MTTIITKLEKNGYELTIYRDEENYTGINIKQREEDFAPSIHDGNNISSRVGILRDGTYSELEFTVQTTSYGAKNVDEIKQVIAGYEKAVEAVEYFENKLTVIENGTEEELEERFDGLVTMFAAEGIEYDSSTQEHSYITVHLTAGLYNIDVDMNLAAPGYFLSTTDCGGTYTAEMMDEGRNHKYVKTLKGVKGYIERMWQK